jgi:hypothetical protein
MQIYVGVDAWHHAFLTFANEERELIPGNKFCLRSWSTGDATYK